MFEDNKLGIIILIAILLFLGKFAWDRVETGYKDMRGVEVERKDSAKRNEKRIDKEMQDAWERR